MTTNAPRSRGAFSFAAASIARSVPPPRPGRRSDAPTRAARPPASPARQMLFTNGIFETVAGVVPLPARSTSSVVPSAASAVGT